MERVRRLHGFWAWLPAFRVVAESEHLPTASAALALSPSALSRSVSQLEESLGVALFDRVGRRITLNPRGQAFLSAVREAMRLIHEGVLAAEGNELVGELVVSCPGPFVAPVLGECLATVTQTHPGISIRLVSLARSDQASALRRGQVDVVLDDGVDDDRDLRIDPVCPLEHDVFCAERHPLAELRGSALRRALDAAPFVVPAVPAGAASPDGWPTSRARNISLRVQRMQAAIDLVRSGGFVAALPTLAAKAHGLYALGVRGLANTELVVARRAPLALPTPADVFAETLLDS